MSTPGGSVTFTIPGPPASKGRPRFTKTGHTFTPARTRIAENRIYLAWQDTRQPRPFDGPVALHVEIALERPQAHWRRDGRLTAAGERSHVPTKKPDLDNAVKAIADALNGCGYRDDAQIAHVDCFKRWCVPGESEHTRVRVAVIDPPEMRDAA